MLIFYLIITNIIFDLLNYNITRINLEIFIIIYSTSFIIVFFLFNINLNINKPYVIIINDFTP